jgi:parallel beta-helix repeat protein
MSRVWSLAVACLSVLGLLVVQGAGSAFATHVGCGQSIAEDTTLDSDLLNCPADGVIIGADHITLDLNGHTIEGDGIDFVTNTAGVKNVGHGDVTVEGGTIRSFARGVRIESASDNVVRELQLSGVGEGILFLGVTDSTIAKNITTPGTLNGLGIYLSDRSQIERNEFRGGPSGAPAVVAIDVEGGSDNVLERNSITNYGLGILRGGGQRTRLTRNTVIGTPLGGIFVFAQSSHVHLERNSVQPSGRDGIFISVGSTQAVLDGNIASASADDGIDVNDPTATLAHNRGDGNGDLGIEAVPGVTDGGGNRAFGNGNPLQCLNVACK